MRLRHSHKLAAQPSNECRILISFEQPSTNETYVNSIRHGLSAMKRVLSV